LGQPLYPGKKILVPIKQEAWYAPELVSRFWRRKISVAPTNICTTDCPAHALVTILNALSQLLIIFFNHIFVTTSNYRLTEYVFIHIKRHSPYTFSDRY
jgi:hypothetical protein